MPFLTALNKASPKLSGLPLRTAPQKWECQQKAYAVVRHMLLRMRRFVCLFLDAFSVLFPQNFNSHKSKLRAPTGRLKARMRGSGTGQRLSILKAGSKSKTKPTTYGTGQKAANRPSRFYKQNTHQNSQAACNPCQHFSSPVIPTGNSWFPKRDFLFLASRSKNDTGRQAHWIHKYSSLPPRSWFI